VGKSAIVNISIPVSGGDPDLLRILNNLHACRTETGYADYDLTVAMWSLFKAVDFRLNSGLSDEFKSKFVEASVDLQCGYLIITLSCIANYSAVRKAINVASRALAPHKTFQLYKKTMGELNQKVDKDHHAWASNQLAKGLKSLKVFVTGSMKIDAEKKRVLEDQLDLIDDTVLKGESKPPSGEKKVAAHGIKFANQTDAYIAHKFLASTGIDSHVQDHHLHVYMGGKASLESKLGDRYKRYVDSKISSLGDRLVDATILSAAITGFVPAGELQALTPQKINKATFTRVLSKIR
jgi:hypothetical protein